MASEARRSEAAGSRREPPASSDSSSRVSTRLLVLSGLADPFFLALLVVLAIVGGLLTSQR